MENLSFKTVYNTNAIEFYPHLIRNEMPVLSGGGGFVSSCCGNNSWNLSENYTIGMMEVDLEGRKAWIVLCKDGVVVDERILTEESEAPVDSDYRYSYVKNGIEIISATLKTAFHGYNTDMVELGELYQRSEVDGSILISNEYHQFLSVTEPSGISWNLSDDYMLTLSDIGYYGDDVRFQLSKSGMVVKEKIMDENEACTFTYTSGIGSINFVIDSIFHGCEANVVKLIDVNQYSDISETALIVDGSHYFKSANPDGMPLELMDGYVLTMKDLSYHNRWWHHVDDEVWLELSKDGSVLKEEILEAGNLFEYKNSLESFDCVVDAIFNGCLANVVKLKNVNQYSNTGVHLIDNELKMFATADPIGEVLELWEGYSFVPKDIDVCGDKAWLSLYKDDIIVKDAIVNEGDWFKYYNATGALIFSTYVETAFAGMNTNLVKVVYITQYSEIDGRLLIEPDTESWQLQEGYYLTAQEIYRNNSVWLQLSKNNKLIDEGLFYDSFMLQNDITDHTIVSGTINSYGVQRGDDVQLFSITQYHEATGTVLTTWSSRTLNASWSFDDTHLLRCPTSIPKTLTVNDSGGADYTSIQAAIIASNPKDTIIVYNGTYNENIIVNKQLTLIGIDMPVVDGGREDSTIEVTADDCTIDGFRVVRGDPYGIYLCGSASSTLQNNEMVENRYNLGISASSLDDYIHDIDTSNTVNGKPVYYLVDKSNIVIDSSTNAGYIGVMNSSNIVVMDLTMENNHQGILFAYTSNSRIENVNTSDNRYGIYLFHSVDNTLTNNKITDNYDGMYLQESPSNVISDNSVSYNRNGINLDYSSYNSLMDNVVVGNSWHGIYVYGNEDEHYNNYIYTSNTVNGKPVYYYYGLNNQIIQNLETTHLTVAGSTNVVIMNNNISGGDGIHLACSGSSTIQGNTISDNHYGIQIHSSDDMITGNTISDNHYGVCVYGHSSNKIQNNILTDQYYGIDLSSTSGNTVSGNTISNSRYDIRMYYFSSDNTISGNTISNSNYGNGICIWYSPRNTVTGNTISTNNQGLWVDGWQDNHFNNSIDTSNTVNGKPVYYYYNIHNQVINNLDASHLTVAYSSDITITDNNISGGDGVRLVYTTDSTVSINTVNSNCESGIYLDESHRNKFTDNMISSNCDDGISISRSQSNEVTDNIISNNDDNGIYLGYSQSNILSDNELFSNQYGIKLYDSQHNTIQHNSILGSYYGIYLSNLSSDNCLYHNNLLYTHINAYDCDSNYWYNGTTGNYWDDYIGMDADDDGIGDVPYNISGGNNQDSYPLMKPYNWEIPKPKSIYVDDDFVDDPANHKWNTIGEGLDDSFYNDTIIVYNGTYSEYVQISTPIRLVGIDMPVVNHSSIEISANRCTLDGFRIISGSIRIYSDENTISNNSVTGDYCGIYLSSSSNNTLKNNAMMGFCVYGDLLSDYIHDIDTSNTVNGKPIYYLINANNQIIDSTSNAGYVGVINSNGITVRDLLLEYNSQGVLFYYTNDSRIENVDVSNSEYGIMLGKSYGNYVANNTINSTGEIAVFLSSSNNNILKNNTINSTDEFAILLDSSGGNTLRDNIINSNYLGLIVLGYIKESYNNSIDTSNILNGKPIYYYYDLHDATIQDLNTTHLTVACSDNMTIKNNNIRNGDFVLLPLLNNSTIIDNTIQDNCYGFLLWYLSNNNTLYHNNFINNTWSNASDEGSDNQWDSGTEGNYYSNYTGTDSNGDGIGDTPHPIPGGNSEDRYPLIAPWNPQ